MKKPPANWRIVILVLAAGVFPWLVGSGARLVFGETPHPQDALHEWFELMGSGIALSVAMLLLLRLRHEPAPSHLVWVVAALVAMGLADSVHAVARFGPERSWLRYSATLVGGWLFASVWLPVPGVILRARRMVIALLGVMTVAASGAVWWWSDRLPPPVLAGSFSFPAKATTVLGGLGFLTAAVFFGRRYRREPRTEDLVLTGHTVLFGTSGLVFPLLHIWAADWWVWHLARLLAYGILIAAAYEMVSALYQRIAWHAQSLEANVRERTAELQLRNTELSSEVLERQRVETALRASEEQYRALTILAPDAVFLNDTAGRILDVNVQACQYLGYSREQLLE